MEKVGFKWAKRSYCGLPSENVAVEAEPVFREIQASLQQDILLECTGVICVQRARPSYSPTDCSTADPNLLTKMKWVLQYNKKPFLSLLRSLQRQTCTGLHPDHCSGNSPKQELMVHPCEDSIPSPVYYLRFSEKRRQAWPGVHGRRIH